jgi:hypothetical protein
MRSLQSSMDSITTADTLIRSLCAKNVKDREIIKGFMLALKSKSKKFRKHIISFLTLQENHIKEIADYFGNKRYYELQEKFKPWVCLHELDFVATVSFCGYEVIQ